MATCQLLSCWGRLLVPGTDGAEDLVYSIEKPLTVIGRLVHITGAQSRQHTAFDAVESAVQVSAACDSGAE
jgi:hypothetical protein